MIYYAYKMLAKKDNLMLKNQFKALSINLNAQHVNGMTHFDLALKGKWVKVQVRLLGPQEYLISATIT